MELIEHSEAETEDPADERVGRRERQRVQSQVPAEEHKQASIQ